MQFLDTSRIRTRFDERIVVADGTELSVDLYLPPEPGRYPVLLNRTASDNNRSGRPGISVAPAERCKAFAACGFIVAIGDVRGRGDSAGTFVPFVHEAIDGATTAAWLRSLDESSGRIGLWGSGYGAFCAWSAAVIDQQVGAVASISPFGAAGEGLLHRSGVVRLEELFWMHIAGGRTVQPANVPSWAEIHRHLPLATMDEALGRTDIAWREWLSHLDPGDSFWSPLQIASAIAKLKVPGLHITGHWDSNFSAARYYHKAASLGGAPQQLVVGPWDSAAVRRPSPQVGGFDFGPRSLIDLDETLIEFFTATLRPSEHLPAISRWFVTGRNEWITREPDAECDRSTFLRLFLSSTHGANTRRGDGVLSENAPTASGIDLVTHNPDVPVEFQPQFRSFATGANALHFTLDQAHITARDEALVYTSQPLAQTLTVLGQAEVRLTVRTPAPDVDLFVLLSDTFPLGARDLHLAHAATRLATLSNFAPGEAIDIVMHLAPLAHDFLEGHQIRLTITPSLFPLYARNPQQSDYANARTACVADIEIHHGPAAMAELMLPVKKGDA